MTSMSSRYLILNKAINDEDFKRKYTIIRKTSATLELINKDGLSGKIIPRPVDRIFEWYDEVRKGTFNVRTNAKDYRHIIGKQDRKSTRLNSSHVAISYAVLCLK